MLLPVALNRHLVCIFCLLQNFTGSWTHNGKIKPWIKKRKKLFQNQTERGRKGCNRIQSKRSSSFREGKTTLHPCSKVICAFWGHVLWEQGLNIRPLSCSRMKSLGQVSSVTYLPSCCFLELILRRRVFPSGSDGKESACNAGDPGLIPGSERIPGEGNGNPSPYSCLGNPMDGGTWRVVHGSHGVRHNWATNTVTVKKRGDLDAPEANLFSGKRYI